METGALDAAGDLQPPVLDPQPAVRGLVPAPRRRLAMKLAVVRCPLCGGTGFEPFERHEESGRELVYLLCPTCGMVLQSPRMSDEELAEFYTAGYRLIVQGTEAATDKDLRIQAGRARHLVRFCRGVLPSVAHHLDIGSFGGALLRAGPRAHGAGGVGG